MAFKPSPAQRRGGLFDPGFLLYWAIKSFVLVLLETLVRQNRPLSNVKDEAFSRFWRFINPPRDPSQPLEGSATLIPPLLATAKGDVLELGPGSGEQVQYFQAAKNARRIYGAEPCLPLHDDLRANATRYGLGDKYHIVTAGAEKETLVPGLAKAGLLTNRSADDGVFDTIVCVRVLCSVKDLHETTEAMFTLLKPGGRLIICEHMVNPGFRGDGRGSYLARLLQSVYQLLGWTFFVGNCHLTRDIRQAVMDAAEPHGGWSAVDLTDNFLWSALPYLAGTVTKRAN